MSLDEIGNNSNEEDGLKTYTNALGKYTIKYPKEYELYENEEATIDGAKFDAPQTITILSPMIDDINSKIRISINYEEGKKLTLEEYNQAKNIPSTGIETTIAGKNGYLFKDTLIGPEPRTIINFYNAGINYNVTIEHPGKYADVKKYTDKILSTLTFLNRNPATANWKTYAIKTTNITFNYPENGVVNELPLNQNGKYNTTISSKEYKITTSFDGSGYDSACKIELKELSFLGKKIEACRMRSFVNETIFFNYDLSDGTTLTVNILNNNVNSSDEFIDDVLSTFKDTSQSSDELKTCGTIQGLRCPNGYKCVLEGNYPDAGGSCVPDR